MQDSIDEADRVANMACAARARVPDDKRNRAKSKAVRDRLTTAIVLNAFRVERLKLWLGTEYRESDPRFVRPVAAIRCATPEDRQREGLWGQLGQR